MRKASIKETGEELSQEEWARFDRAVAEMRALRQRDEPGAAPTTGEVKPDEGNAQRE